MAFSSPLPSEIVDVIAKQVSERLAIPSRNPLFDLDAFESQSINIGENFLIWNFIPDSVPEIDSGNRDIDSLARPSGIWQHQIRVGTKTVGFALSQPLGATPDSWSLREIFSSELAGRIADAIEIIDDQVPDDVEARLLKIAYQQIDAFWFVSPSNSDWHNKIMIVNSATRIPEFTFSKVLPSETFIELQVGKQTGMGLIQR
jgi:hypothetical protein